MNEEPTVAPVNGRNPGKRASTTMAVLRAATTILGIVLVLTPLAFWVAWSKQALLVVMVIGIAATIGLLLCRWLTDDNRYAADSGSERSPRIGPARVSDEFISELSSMGPWTYHNRLTGDARFRKKMARLRKLL